MDQQQLSTFVREQYPRVVAAVGFACGDRGRAEDAVQEVLASALERETQIEHLPGFVVTAALNRVRSGARRDGAERRALERLHGRPVVGGTTTEVDDDVLAALRSLPERQREITALHYLLDMSVAEVGRALGVTDGTVKTQLHRAREALRRQLDPSTDLEHEEDDHVPR